MKNPKLPKGWRVIRGGRSRRQKRALPQPFVFDGRDILPPLPPFGVVHGTGRGRRNDLPSDKRGA